MIRTDLSTKLIHLTRTVDGLSAPQRLGKILSERSLQGSDRDIRGGFKVISFTEAPISMLASVLANAAALEMRYSPLGVMVDKVWLYKLGGRPVVYQSNAEFDELPQSKQHLHVRYEPDRGNDYSWEREWRIKRDSLELDPLTTTVIVPSRDWEAKYHAVHTNRMNAMGMVLDGLPLGRPPHWHFITLDDLGIPFDNLEPISFDDVT